jgi:hypothetical protein
MVRRGEREMTVEFYKAIGEGDFGEIMYNEFCSKLADGHHFASRHVIIYDINNVAVIHRTEDGSILGRNSLRMVGVKEKFTKVISEIEEKTKFKLELESDENANKTI